MDGYADLLPGIMGDIGLWLGLFFSLMVFSALAGDHALARLAQHILVGASLGYAAVLAWQEVLWPRLLAPLIEDPAGRVELWPALALGLLLLLAGGERVLQQSGVLTRPERGWRNVLRVMGVAPVALLVGTGVGVALIGALQGTLLPQVRRAAVTGFDWGASTGLFLTGVLTLVITTGALLHWYGDVERSLASGPRFLRTAARLWAGIGRRALWLAAGVVFARLAAARFSLLIGLVEFYSARIQQTGLWQSLESVWQRWGG